ncbi:MAG: DUF1127 domain-containing protein [Hyphomicrobiaceae bacterium]
MALLNDLIKRYHINRTRAVLNTLSDRQLDDIGLCRADIRPAGYLTWAGAQHGYAMGV